MTRKAKSPPKTNSSQFQKGRRPHNAAHEPSVGNLEELVRLIGNEPRQVTKNGKVLTMSHTEATFRLLVEAAVLGKPRAVSDMIKLMSKHPRMIKNLRHEVTIYINGNLANV